MRRAPEFVEIFDLKTFFFGLHLFRLIHTGINFSCPRAPLEFTQINFLCLLKIYFCSPPSHAILAPGLNRWLSLFYLNKGLNKVLSNSIIYRGGSRGHKARRQGQGHRHKKKFEARAKAKNSPSEDRHSRGQGQECSRPRTRMLEAKTKD